MSVQVFSVTFNAAAPDRDQLPGLLRRAAADIERGRYAGSLHADETQNIMGTWILTRDGEPLLQMIAGADHLHRVAAIRGETVQTACGLMIHASSPSGPRPAGDLTCPRCIAAMTPPEDAAP